MAQDAFSRWLGLSVEEVGEGFCTVSMVVRPEMVNGFGIAHGGISYSLADSALAFASNSLGRHALSVGTSMSHFAPVRPGDQLRAEAREMHRGNRLASYEVNVFTAQEAFIARFQGTVYRTSTAWEVDG